VFLFARDRAAPIIPGAVAGDADGQITGIMPQAGCARFHHFGMRVILSFRRILERHNLCLTLAEEPLATQPD